jgi:hypothetical protein
MTALVEGLIQSPRLLSTWRSCNAFWPRNGRAQERFYEEITEDTNAKFINGQVIMQQIDLRTLGKLTAL